MFYIPRYLWKMWEGQKMRNLVLNLNNPILSDENRDKELNLLVEYLRRNLGNHTTYLYYFTFCEALNFFNVCFQMYLVDAFLGGTFSTYGLDVLRYSEMDQDDRNDPMIRVFPRMTKCTFHRYGSSGDVQRHDALCILPLNIINEKIYIFLWFWFVFLAILSGALMIYRLCILSLDQCRDRVLIGRAKLTDKDDILTVLSSGDAGDWFLLYMLCKNMDPLHYRELVNRLSNPDKVDPDSDNDEEKKLINDDGENYPMVPTLGQSEKK